MRAYLTDDPAAVLARVSEHLASDPVANNLLLTLLHTRIAHPQPGNYGWVEQDGDVVGVLLQSPRSYVMTVSSMPRDAVVALVELVVAELPGAPGVNGEAATAAAFAGEWATRRRCRAEPDEAQRLYRCDRLVEPDAVPGRARRAGEDDVDLLAAWTDAFERETSAEPARDDRVASARALLSSRDVWLWERDGSPVCIVGVTRPLAGAGRIGRCSRRPSTAAAAPPQDSRRTALGCCSTAATSPACTRS